MRKVHCPQCGKETIYSTENQFRPFCSERCRLIDLGEWASGNYRIASKSPLQESDLESALESENQDSVNKNSRRNSEDLS